MAELYGAWFASVFSANSNLQFWISFSACFDSQLHEFSYAFAIYDFEWVYCEDLLFKIGLEEFSFRIVSAEGEGGLGEIVGAE